MTPGTSRARGERMAAAGHSDGTVGKALDLLEEVTAFGRPVRFSELLAGSPYPKATLHRLLQTLASQGMLAHDPVDHSYRPGLRLVRLAHAAWAQASLGPIARPHLDALAAALGETVHLAQLDNGHVLYVDKRNAARPVDMFSQAGKIGPAYCTGVGKALLAFLDPAALEAALSRQAFHRFTPATLTDAAALRRELREIRARGLSFDREEHEAGIICVSAPILTARGRALGALSVTSTTERNRLEDLEALAPELQAAAAGIARDAEAWLFPDAARPRTPKEASPCPA
jgi:IclR family KDG regulon transcriptional repressor